MTIFQLGESSQMLQRRCAALVAAWMLIACFGFATASEAQDKYKIRLAPAPPLGIQRTAVAGIGSASAVLSGRKLTVTGNYENMASPATGARLYIGPVTGVRGESISDLTVSKGTSGTL